MCHIEVRVHLIKLWALKKAHKGMPYRDPSSFGQVVERRTISVNLRKIKINDLKTVIFLTTFKVKCLSADNSIIIPQALRKKKINDIKTVIFFTTIKVKYFNADNNKIIPQASKLYILMQIKT